MKPMYYGIPFSPQATLTDTIGAADTIIKVSDVSAFPDAPNYATIGTDGWTEVRLIASGVSKNTSFNFFEKNGTAAPTSYYFIDDIEVRLLD